MKFMSQINTISWRKDYFLNWNDFQAESNTSAFEDVHSTIKFRYTWTVNSENIDNQINFFIENIVLIAEFYPSLSWVRSSQASPKLLKHEQGHFDLVEVNRNQITLQIQTLFDNKKFPTRGQNQEQQKQFARKDSGLLIANQIEKWEQYIMKKHEEYDAQTNYGQISEKQQEYDNLFDKLRN